MIELVAELLAGAGVTEPPVRLPYVTESIGIRVVPSYKLPAGWDAVLVRGICRTVCYYNPHYSWMRRRFSIAHEIGHYLLHKGKGVSIESRTRWIADSDEMRVEADAFAAELLMPTEWMLDSCLEHPSFDDLRDRFWVSKQAMRRRLRTLGLYIPVTRYPTPTYTTWNTWDRDYALEMYSRADHFHPSLLADSVTGDPYEDYLIMRGVHDARPRSEVACSTSDLESFPCDNSNGLPPTPPSSAL